MTTSMNPTNTRVVCGSLIKTSNGIMIVHKINRKNYVCYDEQGKGWNVPISFQGALPQDAAFNRDGYQNALAKERQRKEDAFTSAVTSELVVGSVVEFIDAKDAKKHPGKYVVVGVPTNKGRVRLVKLGGDNNRYITGPLSMVREVAI